jgi:hypothetical protein
MPAKHLSPLGKLAVSIDGIGLFGPGFADWPMGRAVFAGNAGYIRQTLPLRAPASLPPAERRRTSKIIMLALTVGFEAAESAGADPSSLRTVFASSNGDNYNCHEICSALASSDRQISPTRFHNSVNNAPAGYWSIATKSMAPSFVLCGYDACFAAGLLEAVAQVAVDQVPTLLIAYDIEYPEPLRSYRQDLDTFGVALVLSPSRGERTLAEITVSLTADAPDRLDDGSLEALRANIPSARSLPLLQALARGDRQRVVLDYLNPSRLALEVAPCA